ncbi:glycosyltransferase family 2 protein [Geodermatophilus marinus]|uniref:glycosyltransferase family 2 protein n=1 Tax=Geodermatophilus sp. LHW52908 TaxID=2303986 RepID=UPI000E3DD9E2|nr:glycosyltransferase family 2 protein [Geodermatophilus sp. LHW52908]RFU22392.1 glycosyltransferase [Geodermatophilus sp. LHW52908]
MPTTPSTPAAYPVTTGATPAYRCSPESTVSVVIACYTEARWAGLEAAVRSALEQERRPLEVVVAVDHAPALLDRVARAFPEVRVVPNTASPGASGTRNAGARAARGDVVAFLDDDTRAAPTWLTHLVRGLEETSGTVGAGGRVAADWPGGVAPRWFPPEFLWVVGASYEGMPTGRAEVRNVWSESMAVRREDFLRVGGFRDGFGKLGGDSSPEDTEFCIRAAAATGRSWLYVPDAEIVHDVPASRATWRYFVRRCHAEGRGKAEMAALEEGTALTAERGHVLGAIPRGMWRDARRLLRGDRWGPARAVTAGAGLLAAASGYLAGRRAAVRAAA